MFLRFGLRLCQCLFLGHLLFGHFLRLLRLLLLPALHGSGRFLQLRLDRSGVIGVVIEIAHGRFVANDAHRLVEDHHVQVIVLLEERYGIIERRIGVHGAMRRNVGVEGKLLRHETVLLEAEDIVRVEVELHGEFAQAAGDHALLLAVLVHHHACPAEIGAFDLQTAIDRKGRLCIALEGEHNGHCDKQDPYGEVHVERLIEVCAWIRDRMAEGSDRANGNPEAATGVEERYRDRKDSCR